MALVLTFVAALSLLIWLYLIFLRGGFWRANARLDQEGPAPGTWPSVAAIIPARDEAKVIEQSIASLLTQDYPGTLQIILVDDHSQDGTAEAAARAARSLNQDSRLNLVSARALPAGWSGKLWALEEGLAHARRIDPAPGYIWLSDADIEQDKETLRHLVAKAENEALDLVSLMVALSCGGFWERLLIPPFIYFFQMLYPFAWVNDPKRRTAAAAGGCVLLRRAAIDKIGGFAAIKGELIDDCALARRIKELTPDGGRIWLGLATTARSIRPYSGLGEIWRMVARSAYTQLRYSPLLLAGTLLAMTVTFLAPPLIWLGAPLHDNSIAATAGIVVWAMMTLSVVPTLRLYGQPVWLAALLPLAAAFYCAMTLDSAIQHWRGRGGRWKGRVHPSLGPNLAKVVQKPPGL